MIKTKHNAFTIIELLVAMALLVILAALSSVVFSLTVKSHRTATASIELTRSLRVLTDQLNTDFRGLRTDAPLMIRFYPTIDVSLPNDVGPSCDMIHFFADGDFQTMKQYSNGTDDTTVYGNIARIYYGHANSDPTVTDFDELQILARKSHCLTADDDIISVYADVPIISNSGVIDYSMFDDEFGQTMLSPTHTYILENELEFNTISFNNWLNALNYEDAGAPANANAFIARCMADDSRPFISLTNQALQHLLMAQGVSDFQIQWAYTPDDLDGVVAGFDAGMRWWPSRDPNGDGNYSDDDYYLMDGRSMPLDPFGVYFTLPNGTTEANWFSIDNCSTDDGSGGAVSFLPAFYPQALKFTFTLHDSNGFFEDGKTFTHIVYLDN